VASCVARGCRNLRALYDRAGLLTGVLTSGVESFLAQACLPRRQWWRGVPCAGGRIGRGPVASTGPVTTRRFYGLGSGMFWSGFQHLPAMCGGGVTLGVDFLRPGAGV